MPGLCPIRAETERGLSRKHIIEGKPCVVTPDLSVLTCSPADQHLPPSIHCFDLSSLFLSPPSGLKGSLQRMQLEYVDVVFANRPDSNTPMEGESAHLYQPGHMTRVVGVHPHRQWF